MMKVLEPLLLRHETVSKTSNNKKVAPISKEYSCTTEYQAMGEDTKQLENKIIQNKQKAFDSSFSDVVYQAIREKLKLERKKSQEQIAHVRADIISHFTTDLTNQAEEIKQLRHNFNEQGKQIRQINSNITHFTANQGKEIMGMGSKLSKHDKQ